MPDGSGGFYGSFYDTTTHTVASTTAAYAITLNTTLSNNGVSIGSPTSRIVFDYAGIYSITFSVQYENTNNQAHASTIWLRKNGTDVPDSSSYISVPSSHGGTNGKILTTVNYVLDLNANDYIEVYYQAESTGIQIATIPAGTTPTTPVSPSIILTAVQGGIITQGSTTNSLASLTDVSFTSLASGNIIIANASGIFTNQSMATLVNQLVSFSSLGSLAFLSNVDYNSIYLTNKPSLGSLAPMNQLSFTSLTNQPSLSSLAFQSTIDYTSSQLTNKPSLGSLAVMNQLSFTSLTNLPSLGSLAVLNSLSYTSLSNLPSLGSLAILNDLSYTSLLNLPSLGSLAVLNSLSFTSLLNQPSLSSLAFQSTVDYVTQVTSKPSLGSLAPLNAITQEYLPSNASFSILTTQGIVNTSTVSTNLIRANSITASLASVGILSFASLNGTIYHNSLTSIQGGSAGQYNHLTNAQLTVVQNTSGTNTGDQVLPVYGDGSDGAITFDGSTIYTFATLNGSTYTLTRDIFATTITVDNLIAVITGGYRVFAQNSLTVNGELHNNGSAGSGTTGGAGGLGGFFKAGGAGSAGLGTGSAGAVGTAQATPTANTWVGGLGGKGAMGRATNTTFTGGMITSANVTVPADADGGNRVPSNFVNYLTRYIVGATNWQMTPSIGGGSGAKSTTGSTPAGTSGAGGGGGGICFVASPVISGSGTISANGGAGGNATGANGNFGGGGGGGGGVMCMIAKTSNITPSATGGNGGTTVIDTATGTYPIATAQGTVTTATQTMILTPTVPLTKGNLYMVTFHLQKTGGIGGSGINSMSGFGIQWTNANLRNTFNSIASANRVIEIWYGYYQGTEPDIVDSEEITVELSDLNTSARVIIDEIQNTDASFFTNPIAGNNAINQVDSATTLTVTLPVPPTTGNLVYSVFARSAGTATTAGAGNTLVNNQTTAPQISSQVSSAQQANTQTHTTAAAVAGISMEIVKSVNGANGSNGWDGKVVRIYG